MGMYYLGACHGVYVCMFVVILEVSENMDPLNKRNN